MKMPDGLNHRAFCSGDVLLSHGLSPYYHRGCSVSLPCSEWERVVPLRYCHQSPKPDWRFAVFGGEAGRCRTLGTVIGDRWMVRAGFSFTIHLPLFTRKRTAASLMSTYRLSDSAVIDRHYSDNFV